MKSKAKYLVFLDLDHTLLNVNSGKILVLEAYKQRLITHANILKAIYLYFAHRFNFLSTAALIKKMPDWMIGKTEKVMVDFCQVVFQQKMIKHIRPQMYKEIERHRDSGAGIIILSATFNYVCQPILDHLNLDDMICSKMRVSQGIFSGETDGPLCFGREKMIRLRNYCLDNKYSWENAYYYADSIADLDVLSIVGYPVCINPDKKLAKIAGEKSWPINIW